MSSAQSLVITLLTLSAGIGGFLFGYDTGVISGALPFMRDDLLRDYKENRHLQNFLEELIVSSAILGAACGAAMGGWLSDKIGRKSVLLPPLPPWRPLFQSMLVGDGLFCTGAILMASASNVTLLITGRVVVGIGVGLASVTVPVYIAECSPVSLRASLVTVNSLMITSGQLVSYVVNYGFTYLPGTWRWMLGVAGIPALLQFLALLFLPESPRWLFLTGKGQRAQKVLRQLMPPDEVSGAESEWKGQNRSVAPEKNLFRVAYHRPEIRLQLITGMGLQVLQQICGINTVMYYTPTILEIAGFVNKRQALLLSILPALVNSIGTLIGIWCIDRYGRRKLLLGSLGAVCASLLFAGYAFRMGESSSGRVLPYSEFPSFNSSCPATNCHDCLNTGITQSSCSFCVAPDVGGSFDGICVHTHEAAELCPRASNFSVYEAGCPSPYQSWTVSFLMLYLISFAPGLGPVPWAINAEIYPAEIRGIAGGAAATSNWLSNFIVSQCFLTIAEAIGISGVFLLYSCFALIGIYFVWGYLPETKGLTFEEIQRMYRAKVAPQIPT